MGVAATLPELSEWTLLSIDGELEKDRFRWSRNEREKFT